MNLRLIREPSVNGTTLGVVFSDGRFRCFSLEDEIRAVKVPGQTAIPAGQYPVQLSFSPKFGRVLPEVLNVPHFSGIRIHAGNTKLDTEGCILLGAQRQGLSLVQSRIAVEQFMADLELEQAAGRETWLTVENPWPSS